MVVKFLGAERETNQSMGPRSRPESTYLARQLTSAIPRTAARKRSPTPSKKRTMQAATKAPGEEGVHDLNHRVSPNDPWKYLERCELKQGRSVYDRSKAVTRAYIEVILEELLDPESISIRG